MINNGFIDEVSIGYENKLVLGKFLARPNRFLAEVEVDSKIVTAHIADPGRLKELLIPGQPVYLLPKSNINRKTQWQLLLVKQGETLISLNSQLPNQLIANALQLEKIKELTGYNYIQPEYTIGSSRIDFALGKKPTKDRIFVPECVVEVKSVTLVKDKVALFPDAPTKRGVKHVKELILLKESGVRAVLLFVVQRNDADIVKPNLITDPDFSKALENAKTAGVEILAYRTLLTTEKIILKESIPVVID